jgi:myo-inositol 2-dehydrogenase/D-chiro-inositol 1-dehydrogenase
VVALGLRLNRDLYRLLFRRGGFWFTVNGFLLQQLYYLYSLFQPCRGCCDICRAINCCGGEAAWRVTDPQPWSSWRSWALDGWRRTTTFPHLRSCAASKSKRSPIPLAASRTAAAAAFPAARVYGDYRELIASERIDALVVASPPSTHLDIWNSAARGRVQVLMEKPFVLNGEFARAASSAEARRLLMPNFNRRFWPAYRTMRELCIGGRLGAIERAHFILCVNVRPWCSVTRHRLDSGEGGPLYDLGSSQLDLIEYVLGHGIASVSARVSESQSSGEGIFLDVLLNDGVRVTCEVGYSTRGCESVSVAGTEASFELDNPNSAVHFIPTSARSFPPARWPRDTIAFGGRALIRDRSMLRYTIRAALGEFIDALSSGREFSPGFDDAARNCAALDAAMKSAAEHKPIEVKSIEHNADVYEAQA